MVSALGVPVNRRCLTVLLFSLLPVLGPVMSVRIRLDAATGAGSGDIAVSRS